MFLGTSTAQFLDWFEKALSGPGILRVVAAKYERLQNPGKGSRAPPGSPERAP
jgi:hypothetical protein